MHLTRIFAAALALVTVGCTLLLSTENRTQCETSADCDANPSLSGRACVQGICVVPSLRPEPVSTDAGGCATTEVCSRTLGTAAICRTAGEPCVPLKTADCTSIGLEGWKDPTAIIVGTMLPLTVHQWDKSKLAVPYSQRQAKAIDLALLEWVNQLPGGLTIAGSTAKRPLAVLHCDTQGDPTTAQRIFRHLTEVVRAQGVIVGWDEDLAAVADLAAEKKTAVVCSDCLVPAPQGPKVWRVLPNIVGDAPLAAWRVSQLEAKIRASTPGDIRVGVLSESYRVARAFTDEVTAKLSFNGKTATSQLNDKFKPFGIDDPRSTLVDFDAVVDDIVKFEPHVLVVAMASDFPKNILAGLEQRLAASAPRPHYVLTQMSYEAAPFAAIVSTDELRLRLSGTRPATTPARKLAIEAFAARYQQEHRYPADGTFSGYEAFYAMAYGIVAASAGAAIDGPQISLGFHSLISGPTIDVGPSALIQSGINTLYGPPEAGAPSNHGTFDLRGLTTELDWNLATGEVPSDVAMFCFERQGATLVVKDDDGVRWSPSGGVTGTYSCN